MRESTDGGRAEKKNGIVEETVFGPTARRLSVLLRLRDLWAGFPTPRRMTGWMVWCACWFVWCAGLAVVSRHRPALFWVNVMVAVVFLICGVQFWRLRRRVQALRDYLREKS